ncbi:MAG TPA: 4Fe-4S binding protein [Methylomirabilota bacterium]|jgi:ferredoxin/coenzyme F420-reducing hydrogenase delta subunit
MLARAESDVSHDGWRPPGARGLQAAVASIDRVFDRVYTSAYNPLYRTGTLASLCLAVALVTGIYLLFVYEIARPWESVAAIQGDPYLGRWIRALHRYASDAAVVAVVLHVLRLLAQGKTWGPRALAWITGVLLAAMMFVSAVTGFVLVWDVLGQKIAVAGARMLRLLPLFPDPPDRAFVGDAPVPAQFFFMNLFLHVAVPLGMIFFLWLHTVRLARAAWFPERRLMLVALAGFILLSLIWPAPLPPKADLLAVPGRIATDWFYAAWLPLASFSPATTLGIGGMLIVVLLVVPWLVRPTRAARPGPAAVDPESCEGCEQCFQDCPFDAIQMVTGLHPERHPLLAQVQPDLCVSCGLCTGSCASLAIGPPGHTARDQLAGARRFVADLGEVGQQLLLVSCQHNGGLSERLRSRYAKDGAATLFEVDCAGSLHPGTVSYLGRRFNGTLIMACPSQNCVYREGTTLAEARIVGERKPAVPGQIGRLPVRVLQAATGEWAKVVAAIDALGRSAAPAGARRGSRWAFAAALSACLLALVGAGSRWPQGADSDHAVLRLGWRLAGQVRERCRDLSAEEQATRPVHMRRTRECVSEVLAYDLIATVDGRELTRRRVKSPGLRADRPLSVEEDLKITPGERPVTITFIPAEAGDGGKPLTFEARVLFSPARVVLITYENGRLIAR